MRVEKTMFPTVFISNLYKSMCCYPPCGVPDFLEIGSILVLDQVFNLSVHTDILCSKQSLGRAMIGSIPSWREIFLYNEKRRLELDCLHHLADLLNSFFQICSETHRN